MNVIEATGLGKHYGNSWALRDCSLAVPDGHVVALVGPNGAGKTTLLNLAVGLTSPTAGAVAVLGGAPAGSPVARNGIAFVAQNVPLHQHLTVADMLHLTRNLNLRFDLGYARTRLGELGIPLDRKAGKLSGGQQAQLALTLALARRLQLLVLDEPMASLDPLARHDFMATVLAGMAEDGVSVVLSSHVLAELERVADYLVILSRAASRWPVRSMTFLRAISSQVDRTSRPTATPKASMWCTRCTARPKRSFLFGETGTSTRFRRTGTYVRSLLRNSRWRTCASPTLPRSLDRGAHNLPNRRR